MIPPFELELFVVCLGLFLLMADSFFVKADKSALAYGAMIGLGCVLVLSFFTLPASSGFYEADVLGMFFKRFALLATILTLILAVDYAPVIERLIPGSAPQAGVGEFFVLPVFTCAGLMWLATANDFIMIFCALELVTISFYVQVAYMRRSGASLEAGTKYLILGALSTGFLVYGITWIFGMTGQTGLHQIGEALRIVPVSAGLIFGIALVLVALGFKIAAVPFQFWVPDVYQGAPTPITAYLSVASKAAGFAVLLRVLDPFLNVPALQAKLLAVLGVLAVLTLLYGNLAAIPQTNFKRLLGYSSIAHAGYLLIGIACLTHIGPSFTRSSVIFYLFGYLVMTFLAFLVLVPVAKASGGEEISHFNGLGRRSPRLAFALLLAMLSLAGVPFTVGFAGKLLIFYAAMSQHQYLLVGIGVITVACGFYYYLKVIRAMYWQAPPADAPEIVVSLPSRVAIVILSALILILGVYPELVLRMLR